MAEQLLDMFWWKPTRQAWPGLFHQKAARKGLVERHRSWGGRTEAFCCPNGRGEGWRVGKAASSHARLLVVWVPTEEGGIGPHLPGMENKQLQLPGISPEPPSLGLSLGGGLDFILSLPPNSGKSLESKEDPGPEGS